MPKLENKSYGLTKHETDLLTFTRKHQDAIFSAIISTIASDRLGYTITEYTQFQLKPDMSGVTITETPIESDQPAETEQGAIKEAL